MGNNRYMTFYAPRVQAKAPQHKSVCRSRPDAVRPRYYSSVCSKDSAFMGHPYASTPHDNLPIDFIPLDRPIMQLVNITVTLPSGIIN